MGSALTGALLGLWMLVVTVFAEHEHHIDEHNCKRMKHHDQTYLNGKGGIDFKHFDDGAFVHQMELAEGNNNAACKNPNNWGFDSDKVTVWARNGCAGMFKVGYVRAFCTNISIDATNGYHRRELSDVNNPCYKKSAAYNMKLLNEYSCSHLPKNENGEMKMKCKCGDHEMELTKEQHGKIHDEVKHARHTGQGWKYGFFNRFVWADYGCWGLFKVCEVGKKMDMAKMNM